MVNSDAVGMSARAEPVIEFDCEGCGDHISGFGRYTIPANHLCFVCDWLCEHIPDPDEFWAAYRGSRAVGGV